MLDYSQYRTIEDLERAVRAIGFYFDTDAVVVVGSQAAMVGWQNTPQGMRRTEEIDIYPLLTEAWSAANDVPADDHVDSNFGRNTLFHKTHGFYIDGVSPETATLPVGWQSRTLYMQVSTYNDKTVTAIAPDREDLVIAKSMRLADKDIAYILSCHNWRPLDVAAILERLENLDRPVERPIIDKAAEFFRSLPKMNVTIVPPVPRFPIPEYPAETHNGALAPNGKSFTVREFDPRSRLFVKVGNPLGPAVVTAEGEKYFLHGKPMSREEWEAHPDVVARDRNAVAAI